MTNPNILRTLRLISVLIVISLMTASCEFEYDNKGYPKIVALPAEGGTVLAKGEAPIKHFWITNGTDSDYSPDKTDEPISASLEWLTVTSIPEENTLVFEATPQKENESRTLEVSGTIYGNIIFEIKVIRE